MEQKDYRLAAIMYTDIAGFSRMMESDEAGTLKLLRYHNELLGSIVTAHHGTVIKTIGDALLVDFKNTVEALQSALEIQDKLYAHNKETKDAEPLLVRIGVHLGDIYFFENDALGEGINIAARLQSLARPGCICFSQDVYNLVLNKIEFRAEKLGKVSLKNITKEIHAYEITTPNVEFDPNKDKPRPGYKPGTYLGEGAPHESADSHAPGYRPAPVAPPAQQAQPAQQAPVAPGPGTEGAERSYSPEGSRQVLDEIRKAILQDIKTEGRRLSVDEAIARYGSYGVEASEVIATMLEDGLLVRERKEDPPSGTAGASGPSIAKGFFTGSDGSFDPEVLGKEHRGHGTRHRRGHRARRGWLARRSRGRPAPGARVQAPRTRYAVHGSARRPVPGSRRRIPRPAHEEVGREALREGRMEPQVRGEKLEL